MDSALLDLEASRLRHVDSPSHETVAPTQILRNSAVQSSALVLRNSIAQTKLDAMETRLVTKNTFQNHCFSTSDASALLDSVGPRQTLVPYCIMLCISHLDMDRCGQNRNRSCLRLSTCSQCKLAASCHLLDAPVSTSSCHQRNSCRHRPKLSPVDPVAIDVVVGRLEL